MSAIDSEQFRGPLQDVIRWCAARPLLSEEPDSPALLRRRALLQEANALWNEAIQAANMGWRKRRVSDTEQWMTAQRIFVDIRESAKSILSTLWNPQLKPALLPGDCIYASDFDWLAAVEEVALKRSQALALAGTTDDRPAFATGGRFLLYFPQDNLADGAAQMSSGGFYDADNVPPWDLWVGFSGKALISWVSPALIDLAQMGIDANPEECIRWADR